MEHSFEKGRLNVHHLTAPYNLLVKAFGNDGTTAPRDDYKSMAQWGIATPHGPVEVYDYKVGKCYDSDGLERHEITYWHVQGSDDAIAHMLEMVDAASEPETVDTGKPATPATQPGEFVFQIILNNGTVKRIRGDRAEMGAGRTAVYVGRSDEHEWQAVYTINTNEVFDLLRSDAEVSTFTPDTADAQLDRLRGEVIRLEEEAEELAALKAAGVDGWEGYDAAMEIRARRRAGDLGADD